MEDAVYLAFLYVLVYGWALVWPVARWWLRMSPQRIALLGWILAVSLALSLFAHLFVWYLQQSGNRDWWMATGFIQLVGMGAWFANVVAVVILWASSAPKGK